MIDRDGFRPNVGMILARSDGRVFWGCRVGQRGWQFPQGGIRSEEASREALYRELYEEVGLLPHHVEVLGSTRDWLRYRLPRRFIRRRGRPRCIGQKQVWYLLRFTGDDRDIHLDVSDEPEFEDFQWVHYWRPAEEVVFFKRAVYRCALAELAPLAPGGAEPGTGAEGVTAEAADESGLLTSD